MGVKKETGSDWLDWIKKKKGKAPEGESLPPGGQEAQEGVAPGEPSQQTIAPPSSPPEKKGVDEQIDDLFGSPESGDLPGGAPAGATPESPEVTPEHLKPAPPQDAPDIEPVAPTPPRPEASSAGRLPKDVFACIALIDIGVKTRELPRFFPLKRLRTLAGRHVRAQINLDDEHTVKPEHARIAYHEQDGKSSFSIFPLSEATVRVNGTPVSASGVVLKSGDLVTMGSATLIFFQKNLKEYGS